MRRLAVGERADVTDGAGAVAECVVTGVRPGAVELAVLARRSEPRSEPRIVVVQAIPKGDRGELAVGRQGARPLAGHGAGGGQAVAQGLDPRGDRA